MRALIQRTQRASVTISEKIHSSIGKGLLILLGIEEADTQEDIDYLVGKISRLRIFDDENGVMNLDITQVGGDAMVVSQFTLHASTKKGNRPSYIRSAPGSISKPMYEKFVETLRTTLAKKIATGEFGADMKVELINDGPVTIWIDSKNREY
ncbi:MAG: D-tyrosyl-tRNA(Tyr) deacylase [Alistipes sp.]|nr:D-tyrosyl-tRNA(Tyr) deacylase [Alistipes sp.]